MPLYHSWKTEILSPPPTKFSSGKKNTSFEMHWKGNQWYCSPNPPILTSFDQNLMKSILEWNILLFYNTHLHHQIHFHANGKWFEFRFCFTFSQLCKTHHLLKGFFNMLMSPCGFYVYWEIIYMMMSSKYSRSSV